MKPLVHKELILMNTLKSILFTLCAALSLVGLAQDGHIMVTPDALQWRDGPPSLPAGAQFVVLEGSPAEEGPLTLRLKFPAGFEIPAHWHPALEHVTVLAGTFYMGMGEELDRAKGNEFPVGSFVVIPVETPHFAWAGDEEVIVQLHSNGPFDSIYVDPANDPRNQ
jgi:quercetin dioxygenase-like cupin family protein